MDKIIIKGAREHNLKNIDLEIPRDKLVVITGISGSGKSTLAFDTIYAEGQRRYVESLSAYARQFLGQMEKPDVDHIDGLSPAISIDQKSRTKNPRSTVGTITEIYDYLRLLYARIGIPHCPKCGKKIKRQTPQEIIKQIMKLPEGTKFQILAPLVRGRKGEYSELFGQVRKEGFSRVKVDGKIRSVDETIKLDRYKIHHISVVVDRLVMKKGIKRRLADSVEVALSLGEGIVVIDIIGEKERMFSQQLACFSCGISLEELAPRMFSFNSPYGACSACSGIGTNDEIDPELVIPDPSLSISEGAIGPYRGKRVGYYKQLVRAVCEQYDIDMEKPFKDLSRKQQEIILYGSSEEPVCIKYRSASSGRVSNWYTAYEGVINNLARRYRETESDYAREKISQFMRLISCSECEGARLRKESLAVTIGSINIYQFSQMSAKQALNFLKGLKLNKRELLIGERVIKEIRNRLKFLIDVGLDYLTLERKAATLAGGEAQRIRLATQIGSSLVGVLYILDEPSIGLHLRDNRRLLNTLIRLRDLGNTVLVVEHDEATMRTADHIIDIGPGAGIHGGKIVEQGPLSKIIKNPKSITGMYLNGQKSIDVPDIRREDKGKHLTIEGASEHNLKNIDVPIPLGLFVSVTGVSGSGKSTLVCDILSRALSSQFYQSKERPGAHKSIKGTEDVDKVIEIDQSPIGRTPRSNPATYVKVFDEIRKVFAEVPESKVRGYTPGRFSFNVKAGRCEACQGGGTIKIEMHFLPDIYITCEECKGKRYNEETLEIKFKGKNISDVLDMTVEEALGFFQNIPKIQRKLQTLYDVGLEYLELGQPAPTLSGGEAQRVKLASELSKRGTGKTFYILDEPTTGLHFDDISKLLSVLNRLVDQGNTILVIEHNPDVIKTADYIIDLGPEGGEEGGGYVVATGTPEEIAKCSKSYTGKFLKKLLKQSKKPGIIQEIKLS